MLELLSYSRYTSNCQYPALKTSPSLLPLTFPPLPPSQNHSEPPCVYPKNTSHLTLGDLQVLPIELLNIVFQFCDLQSLFHFLRLNSLAHAILKNSATYTMLEKHVSGPLRVFAKTRVASYYTVPQVLHVLTETDKCAACGKFGWFLYLPECKRCCIRCVFSKPEFETIAKTDAMHGFGLSAESVSALPAVATSSSTRSMRLISKSRAHEAAIAEHGGESEFEAFLKDRGSLSKQLCDSKMARRATHSFKNEKRNRNRRALVTTPFPVIERATGVAHYGIACRSCVDASFSGHGHEEAYTEEEFYTHIVYDCHWAETRWRRVTEE